MSRWATFNWLFENSSGNVQRIEPALLKFVDHDILRTFYERQYSTEGYTALRRRRFFTELHKYKLGRLRDLFARYIPRGRVIDVGCGRSLFTELEGPFPFTIYAGDLNFDSVHARAVQIPHQQWAVFDAAAVPFRDAEFDALFAGEVIEHVTDVRETLHEWWRVLKPGGVAIITTPNKERLVALADGLECPYSRDHLSEMSYREADTGFSPQLRVRVRGAVVSLPGAVAPEPLQRPPGAGLPQRQGNTVEHVDMMRRLLPLGRWFPWVSMALVVVARKKGGLPFEF